MKAFVLEVLDGDQAGTVVELGEGRLSIGRRPDNGLVLSDEKCSGHHAEVVFEDGRHVLRDLGSTNGTSLDGRPVREVVLSPRDLVVLGRVRACYRAADDAAGAGGSFDDFQLGKIDAATLARSGVRRGSLAWTGLFAVVLAAGGLFAWLTYFSGEPGQGPRQQRPLEIPGNRLPDPVANIEAEGGWNLQAVLEAAPFEVTVGRAFTNSGNAALVAEHTAAADGDPARVFALARTTETVVVTSGQALRISAYVRTVGGGRLALRALFGAGDDPAYLRTGGAPMASADGFTEVSLDVRAPRGAERIAIELLAFVPSAGDQVLVDDIALRGEGSAEAIEGTAGGATLVGAGASLRIDAVALPILLGVTPLAGGDPVLAALAALDLMVPSDAGFALAVELAPGEAGFRLAWSGGSTSGLALELPPESAVVRTRADEGGFVPQDATFELTGVREILCGTSDNRTLIRLPASSAVRGASTAASWRIELPRNTELELLTAFTAEVVQAREDYRAASAARDAGRPGEALATLDALIANVPHDARSLRQAQELRQELIATQEREVESLLREGAEAAFFDARVGYQREIAAVDALVDRYGEARIARIDAVRAMRAAMEAALAALDEREGAERAELLGMLADAFGQAGDDGLARFVGDYLSKREESLRQLRELAAAQRGK